MSYYDRKKNSDGSFEKEIDKENEERARALIEAKWKCRIHRFAGHYNAIDFYAERDGKIIALIEVKGKSCNTDRYENTMLNVRKWLALMMAQNGLGVPAYIFFVYRNEVRYCLVSQVEASVLSMGGTSRVVKAISDIEPIIYIPVSSLSVFSASDIT